MFERISSIVSKTLGDKSVPMRLKMLLTLTMAATLLFCFCVETGAYQHHHASKTVGVDAAPSVFAAYDIKIYAQILDADLANVLTAKPGQDMVSLRDFEATRVKLSEALVAAAENITFDASEREPIRKLQDGIGNYLSAAARAQSIHEKGDPAFIVEYHNSLRILKEQLLPSADALEAANATVLEKTFSVQSLESLGTLAVVLLVGLALLGLQLYTQYYLTKNFKRRFNAGLLASSGLTAMAILYFCFALVSQNSHLKSAKLAAYDSVLDLYKAKAFAHEANAAESRYLLDTPQASTHELTFTTAVGKLLTFSHGTNYASVVDVASRSKADQLKKRLAGTSGSLIDELGNITFPGEQEAATATVKSLGEYVGIDAKMRALESRGQHEDAVALSIGMNPGESNWAFDRFNANLDKTMEINRTEFKQDISTSLARVSVVPKVSPIIGILIALGAFLGLRPRMKEFPQSAFKKVRS